VLLSGGFDLSVGAIAALSGILMAKVLDQGLPGGLVLVIVVAVGALIGGVVNGLLIGRLKLSTFVVTLASMIALSGAVDLWAKAQSFYVTAPVVRTLAFDKFAGLPTPIWVMIGVFLGALYLQSRTYLGRDIYAIGGSPVAAELAGIRISRTLVIVYALVGACAALGGALAVGRIGAAVPQVDNTLPLEAIAAVLLGGTALTGGSGGVGGTALGVLFIAVLENGLSLSGVAAEWQSVVTGVILIVAVLGDRMRFGGWPRRSAVPGDGPASDPNSSTPSGSSVGSLAQAS
jgi:ribose transport system permease protein